MLSRLALRSSRPGIKVSQYTSPDRKMSLPPPEPGLTSNVTIPWLLSPKWSASEPTWSGKRFMKPPREALAEMFELYLLLRSEFSYPPIWFKGGQPVMTQLYVKTQYHVMKLRRLLSEVETLKVSEADEINRTKLLDMIRRAIAGVDEWVEQEREGAQEFEENFRFQPAKEGSRKGYLKSLGCIIT